MADLWSFEEWTRHPQRPEEDVEEEMALGTTREEAEREWLDVLLRNRRVLSRLRLHNGSYTLRGRKG